MLFWRQVVVQSNYLKCLSEFKKLNKNYFNDIDSIYTEMSFERIYTDSSHESITELLNWYNEQVKKCTMKVERISVLECKGWVLDEVNGSIVHESGEFFRVDGIKVFNSNDREVADGWEQPILTQVGYDGGILGLIRKRINGLPHYLVEAKSEPGNPNIVQISTTLQATFSNIKKAHGGKTTPFVEFFLDPRNNNAEIVFERWMSEDGGRLFNKRNKSMIVETESKIDIPSDRYRWVTLHQLVQLIRASDAIVAPHIRGILSAV